MQCHGSATQTIVSDFSSVQLQNSELKAKALKEAQEYIKSTKPAPPQEPQSTDEPWKEAIDDIFFSKQKRGLATFFLRRGSPRYDEFKGTQRDRCSKRQELHSDLIEYLVRAGFYVKYSWLRRWKVQCESRDKSVESTKGQALKEESETMRNAIILFHDYYQKQQAAAKAKIEKDRQNLPITKYEKAIVYTLRKHRVLLVAGDTGCGKSTQGRKPL